MTGFNAAMAVPLSGMPGRLWAFVQERAPLKIYLTYAVLWVLALAGALHLAAAEPVTWRLGPALVGEIVTIWLALLFARIVDEQKDLEYDRVHNPGRPLPRGAVGVRDLRVAMALITVVVLAVNSWRYPLPTGWLLFDFAYICFLVRLDRWSVRVRDGIFLNLLVSYPVQLMLSVHVWLVFLQDTGSRPDWAGVLLLAMFACVFLHFEFARKTRHSHVEGAFLYSNVVGVRGSVGLALGLGLTAALIALLVLQPWQVAGPASLAAWLPFSALGCLWVGAERFLVRREAAWPAGAGMAFIAWFYLGLAVQALVVGNITVAW